MEDSTKKTLIIGAVILIAVIVLLLLLRSCRGCESYKIEEEEERTEGTPEELIERIEIAPPTAENFTTGREELSAFILANTEFGCELLKNPEIEESAERSENLTKTAYEKYGFPVENTPIMMEILAKYENIDEVTQIIRINVQNCD